MEAELAALAAQGAGAVVGLMASAASSEAREGAKSRLARFVRLLGRRGPAETAEAEADLQEARAGLEHALAAGDTTAAARIEDAWRLRLLAVLQADPAAADELRRLLADLAAPPRHDTPPAHANTISGGVVNGPVVQAAHVHSITFHVPPAPPSGTVVRPDQVPALTFAFSNRSAELAVLDQAFAVEDDGSGRVRVSALDGMPGVGKTTTAWHWADRARDRFPGGQLYVDYAALRRQVGDAAALGADVSEALAWCLRGLGVPDAWIPASLAERAGLFRSCSADRCVLVVIDDVSGPAQVRPLIPKGRGSAVLVTSHGRLGELALDGARLISVEPLDAHGGLALLADRCGEQAVAAERAAAERLVELCGGLPVALQVVAARLLTDAALTMASLAAELDDEAARLAGMSLHGEERSVSTALGPAYRQLPPDAARLYRLWGLLPTGTADAGVAAAAAELDVERVRPLLSALVAAHLLERTDDGRYRMHALVRLHAREQAAAEEPATAEAALTLRVGTHYLALTAFADRALRQNRLRIADLSQLLRDSTDPFATTEGPAAGPPPLEWLDAERHAVLAVLRAAARHGFHPLVWALAEAFSALFLHHRYLGAWRESLELGAAAAAAAVEPAAEARLRSLLSRPLLDLGEDDLARAELEAAVACAEVADHLVVRASVQEFYGRYWDRHDPLRAVAAYETSRALNERAEEPRGAAIAAFFLGCAHDAAGHHALALTTLRDARRDLLAGREPDLRMAARATAAIGAVHDHLGDTESAVRELREAVRVLDARDATHYKAQALVRLADITERTGGPGADVRAWLTEAAEIYEAGGDPAADRLRQRLARGDDAP
ncbi:NB-ARC domain-containing protein [Streptomyces sp. NPDC059063]|uniref:NB-ARC domain-containing protein n=1 Tax=unclassified Streptomyces TaxID=2593676 RepID=UPI0036CEF9C1